MDKNKTPTLFAVSNAEKCFLVCAQSAHSSVVIGFVWHLISADPSPLAERLVFTYGICYFLRWVWYRVLGT